MNHIDKLIVFYFSGTGNSKRIALWLSELALKNNIICHIYDIAAIDISTLLTIDTKATIGIISPIHGFNFPKITLNFIRNLPDGKNRVKIFRLCNTWLNRCCFYAYFIHFKEKRISNCRANTLRYAIELDFDSSGTKM